MPSCPLCGRESLQAPDGSARCPACGGTSSPAATLSDQQAARPDEILRTIAPRKLTADQMALVSQMWGPTVKPESSPQMTLKADASLIVGSDSVVKMRDVYKAGSEEARPADYLLLETIGEGGVGVVYAAQQPSINRVVAIKMLHAHLAHDNEHRAKFLSEAVVTGDLDHPNIVPIHEVAADRSGALFYSMKRVQGRPWARVIRQKSLAENLDILMKVADALAFAHSRGIIHRDLKPENVMLGDFGEVFVMDWGIALSTSSFLKSESITQSTSMGGTPAYMAPEMATGPVESIGTASDVYLLGAVLYEIISGHPPHQGRDVMACLRAAARNEIQPTGRAGELLEIGHRALATRPQDRFGSVLEFQAALRGYQSHSESDLLSTRAVERLTQAGQTRDYQDFAAALFAFQEALAIWDGNAVARAGLPATQRRYAGAALEKGDYDLGLSLLDPALPDHAALAEEIRIARQERQARQQRLQTARRAVVALAAMVLLIVTGSLLAVNHLWQQAVVDRDAALAAQDEAIAAEKKAVAAEKEAVAAQKEAVAAQAAEESAKLKEAAAAALAQSRQQIAERAQQQERRARVAAVQARRDAERAGYVSQIGLAAERIASNAFQDAVRLLERAEQPGRSQYRHWEAGYLRYLCDRAQQTRDVGQRVESVACAVEGGIVVAGHADGTVSVWNDQLAEQTTLTHGGAVLAVAITRDGRHVATGGEGTGEIKIWQLDEGGKAAKLQQTLTGHGYAVLSLAFSPQGDRLLSSSRDSTARLWNWRGAAPQQLQAFRGHIGAVFHAAFSPDAQRIVTTTDGSVRVWDSSTAELLTRFERHQGAVYAAVFSPDGRYVASAGHDERILVWDPERVADVDYVSGGSEQNPSQVGYTRESELSPPSDPAIYRVLEGHTAEVRSLAFLPGGSQNGGHMLLSAGHDNTVRLWNVTSASASGDSVQILRGHGGWVRAAAVLPDGLRVVSGSYDGTLKIWDPRLYEEVRELRGHDSPLAAAALSPDGRRALTAGRDGRALLWNVGSGQPLSILPVDPVTERDQPQERVSEKRDHVDRPLRGRMMNHVDRPLRGRMASVSERRDHGKTQPSELAEGHEFFLASNAVFFPSGERRLLTAGDDASVRLWDLASGAQLHTFHNTGQSGAIALSDEGRWLVTGSDGNAALLWDVEDLGGEAVRLEGHVVTAAAFSHGEPENRRLLIGDDNGSCRLWRWDANDQSWLFERDLLYHLGGHSITAVHFLPDNRHVLTASQDYTVMCWDVETGERLADRTLKHPGEVRAMAVSPDGRRCVTVCFDTARGARPAGVYRLFLWDLQQGVLLRASGGGASEDAVTSIAYLGEGSSVVLATGDSVLRWELDDEPPQPLWPDAIGGERIEAVVPSPDESMILTVGGRHARLREANSGRLVQSFSHQGPLNACAFSPTARLAVTAGTDGSVKIWSVDEQAADLGQVRWKIVQAHGGGVNSAVFAPGAGGDDLLLTAGADNTARLWNLQTQPPELLTTFAGHTQPVRQAVFSPDGQTVATASLDGTVRLWEIPAPGTPPVGHVLSGDRIHDLGVQCLSFSPDGQYLLTGSDDNLIRLWDLADPAAPQSFEGHTAGITSLAFSPDGRRVLSASRDGVAKLWDTDSRDQVLNLSRHSSEVTAVAFSAAGDLVLTASSDRTAIVWRAEAISPTIVLTEEDLAYPEPGSPLPIDDQARLYDPDTQRFDGAVLTSQIIEPQPSASPTEELAVQNSEDGGARIICSDGRVQYDRGDGTGPVTIGQLVDQADPTTLHVHLTEEATRAAVQSLLRSIAYTSHDPVTSPRTIRFELTTADGLESHPAERKIAPQAIDIHGSP